MLPMIVPISSLLTGVSLLLVGSGLLNTLLAINGTRQGFDDATLGMVMSGYFIGFFVGTFLSIRVITRIGHIRTFAICAAIASCSVLLHVLFQNPWVWLILRVITGAALVILYTVIESWLNTQSSKEERGQLFAVYMLVNLISLAIAQHFIRLEFEQSFILFAIACMFVSISLIPVAWTRLPQPVVNEITHMKIKQLYKIAPVAVVGAFISGLAMGAFWGMGAVYANRVGMSLEGVATFMSCAILGGALFQYPLGRFSDRNDRRKVVLMTTLAAALAATLLMVLASFGSWIVIAIAIYGGFAFAVYPVTVAHLVDHLDTDAVLSGVSGLLLIHGVGAAVGPTLAGTAMKISGPQALPIYFITMQLLLCLFSWLILRSRKEDELEHPSAFVTMVRTTPSAIEMMPDTELDQNKPLVDSDANQQTP